MQRRLTIDRDMDIKAPHWPNYRGHSELVGTSASGKVTVYVDPRLGSPGLQNATDLLADADRVVAANDSIFGTTGGPVSVIVFALNGATDGTGGADHMGCDYTTGSAIEVCAAFGRSDRVSALFEAELSECSMNGRLCGLSTGEALSRWCAASTSNNALGDFATAPDWANNGMPDFVNRVDDTDQNPISTGCGMAFISWLISTGYALNRIAPAMVSLGDSGTLAQLYSRLTSRPTSEALDAFRTAVAALPNGITDDDPFGGVQQAASASHLTAATISIAGEVFASILAGLTANKAPEEIVATVRTIVYSTAPSNGRSKGCCKGTSRRLLPPR